MSADTVRRYDGSTEHADWCPFGDHEGRCLDRLLESMGYCTCVPGEGCDAEGDPGCLYCQHIDPEWPCPADPDQIDGKGSDAGR